MSAQIQDGPAYLQRGLPLERLISAFNCRPHPRDMAPDARYREVVSLADAQVPLIVFNTRMVELADRELCSFGHPDARTQIAEEARSGTRMTAAPLQQISVDDCSPKR